MLIDDMVGIAECRYEIGKWNDYYALHKHYKHFIITWGCTVKGFKQNGNN